MKLLDLLMERYDSTYSHYHINNGMQYEDVKLFAKSLKDKKDKKRKYIQEYRVIYIPKFPKKWYIIQPGDMNWKYGINAMDFLKYQQNDLLIRLRKNIIK